MKQPNKHSKSELKRYTFCLITQYTTGRSPLFGEWPQLKDIAERAWMQNLHEFPQVLSENFVVEPRCLHALLKTSREIPSQAQAASLFLQVVNAFREASQLEWLKFSDAAMIEHPTQLWQEDCKLYPINTHGELENMKEFIIQKLIEAEFSLPEAETMDPLELWDVSDPEDTGEPPAHRDPEDDWLDWDEMI